MSSPAGPLLKEARRYLPGTLVAFAAGAANVAILPRLLGPDQFGIFAAGMAWVMVGMAIGGEWAAQIGIRFMGDAPELAWSTFARLALIAALAAATLVAVGTSLSAGLSIGVMAASVAGMRAITRAATSLLQARLEGGRFAAVSAFGAVTAVIASVVGGFVSGGRAVGVFAGLGIAAAVHVGLAGGVVFARTRRARPNRGPRTQAAAAYAWPMVIVAASSQIIHLGDRVMLDVLRGPESVGRYAVAYSVIDRGLGLLLAPLMAALLPVVARNWDDGRKIEAASACSAGAAVIATIGLGTLPAAVYWGEPMLGLVAGDEYRTAWAVIPVTLLGVSIWHIGIFQHTYFEVVKKTGVLGALLVAAAATNVVLNLLFIPDYGVIGAAWATTLTYLAYALVVAAYTERYGFRLPVRTWRVAGLPLTCGVLFVWLLGLFGPNRESAFAVMSLAGYIVIVAAAALFGYRRWRVPL